jgi:DNA polymerase III epsilon subunit-like protein
MMNNLMIDIETLGVRPGAAIASIAIVPFDPNAGKVADEMFFATIDVKGQKEYSMHQEIETVEWWLSQPEEIRAVSFPDKPDFDDLSLALEKVQEYVLRTGKDVKVWSHGASFDIPILSEAFYSTGLTIPWHFKNIRDTRTLLDFAAQQGYGVNWETPNKHDPRADVYAQAKAICVVSQILKVEK